MKKGKRLDLCPLCGGERKPQKTTARAKVRAGVALVPKGLETESFGAESSDDDKTANNFAAALLNARKMRL